MKVLLLEYITAGGLNRVPLDNALLPEAILMRDALLKDFNDIPGLELITTYDARLIQPDYDLQVILIDGTMNADSVWHMCLKECDAALIVAPETSGILNKLTAMIETSQVHNLGSHLKETILFSNKYDTYRWLSAANILSIATYEADKISESDLMSDYGYIVKPNDGAGCEATYYFYERAAMLAWLINQSGDKRLQAQMIVQPFQPGQAASISALFKQGQAWVLSCNQQVIEIHDDNTVHLNGCRVNAGQQYLPAFNLLANQIAAAIPTLNGYVGIDVIINNDVIYVVEINPRITTSYIGLRESLNYNPAQLILDLVLNPTFELPHSLSKNIVEINLNA